MKIKNYIENFFILNNKTKIIVLSFTLYIASSWASHINLIGFFKEIKEKNIMLFAWQISGLFLLFILFIFYIIKYIIPNISNKEINVIDSYFFILLFASICLAIEKAVLHNNFIFIIIAVSLIVIIVLRIVCYEATNIKNECDDFNYQADGENRSFYNDGFPEKDLLGGEMYAKILFEIIQKTKQIPKFKIALIGKWGVGKTSVLNFLYEYYLKVNQKEYHTIMFAAWKYNDEESMLNAMLSEIVEKINVGFLSFQKKIQILNILDMIFVNRNISILDCIAPNVIADENKLLSLIDGKLKKNNQKLIFIIDDIDRMQPQNILFIYKAVAALLKINTVTFILAYDDGVIRKAFDKLSIDYKYLEKIINKKVEIVYDKEKILEIAKLNLKKTLTENFQVEEIKINDKDLDFLIELFDNIRDIKLFLNNLPLSFEKRFKFLDINDFLFITYIKTFNCSLYIYVFENRDYFVSGIEKRSNDFSILVNMPLALDKAKTFFEEFNSRNEKASSELSILKRIFPVYAHYSKNNTIFSPKSDSKNKARIDKKISCSIYTNLYFYDFYNEELKNEEWGEEFVKDIENEKHFNELIEKGVEFQKTVIESLSIRLDCFGKNEKLKLLVFWIKVFNQLNREPANYNFSAKQVAIQLIVNLLYYIDSEEDQAIISNHMISVKNIFLIYSILEIIKEDGKHNCDDKKGVIFNCYSNQYNELLNRIYKEEIDIYLDENYVFRNGKIIFETADSKDKVIKFFKKIVNKENIIRFIYDFMQGRKVENRNSKKFECYINCIKVNSIVSNEKIKSWVRNKELSDDEKSVYEVYTSSIKISNFDPVDKYPVILEEFRVLKL